MNAGFLRILDKFGARQTDRATLYLDLQIRPVVAWHLRDQHEAVVFTEDVQGRVAAAGTRARSQPIATSKRIEGILNTQECARRFRKHCHSTSPYLLTEPGRAARRSGNEPNCGSS